jgi:phage shock protein A
MKANLLDSIKSNYEDSKQSFEAMESNIEKMDKKIDKTKEENASIDNLPPIPAGPAVK